MFRIQENLDGTTSIYCKNNGNLLCKIPTKGNSSVPRPVNVVEPQPSANAKWLNNRHSFSSNEKPGQSYQKEESSSSSDNEDPKGDLVDHSSQEGFLRFFDLVPKERLQSTPIEKIRAEWPLRVISRTKACKYPGKEDKIPEQLPLTSHWAVKLLPMLGKGHFLNKEKLQALLRSYDSFCRHPYNTACPTSCHFPKLRCREKKQYAISTPPKVLRNLDTAHTYSMGRRQREERKKTLRTGLDTRSRRLLRKFGATPCVVRLQRMPRAEIEDWLSRRSPPSDSDSDIEIIETDPTYRPSVKVARATQSRPRRSKTKEEPKDKKVLLPKTRPCAVYLRDVVLDIRRRNNSYYYRDTGIRVSNYRDFLNSLRANRSLLNRVYTARCLDSPSAFQRNNIPTKPSTSFHDVFMTPTSAKGPNGMYQEVFAPPYKWSDASRSVQNGIKRKASNVFEDKAVQKIVKPSQRQVAKVGQKTQPTTMKTKGSMQLMPSAKNSPVVLDLDKNSSAIRQLMKSPASKQEESSEDILLIDLTEDSPPREKSRWTYTTGAGLSVCPIGQLSGPKNTKRNYQIVKTNGPTFENPSVCKTVSSKVVRQCDERPLQPALETLKMRRLLPGDTSRPPKTLLYRQPDHTFAVHPETSNVHRPTRENVRHETFRKSSLETSEKNLKSVEQDRHRILLTQWNFRCFACGFQKFFYSPQDQPKAVEKAVNDHLHLFHSVSDPEAFISRYLDSVNRCTVIEAFPGFKEPED